MKGLTNVASISLGSATSKGHTCALLGDGTVKCWGNNIGGQLGNGESHTYSSKPVAVQGLTNAVAISANGQLTCALLADAKAKCWGGNGDGALGDGTTTNSSTPVFVKGIDNATAISAGSAHACALLANGTAKCWGANWGRLGNGSLRRSSVPVAVTGLTNTVAIGAGDQGTCALLANGTVKCWGANFYGELGNGTRNPSTKPNLAVVGLSPAAGAVAITAGAGHSCALLANGTAKCWGYNMTGALGNGSPGHSVTTPVVVTGLANAVAITAGASSTCALLANGTVQCWGISAVTQVITSTPVAVPGLANAVAITAGYVSTCARLANGTAKCWGVNSNGQLGDGTTTDSTLPVAVLGLTNAVSIWLGNVAPAYHACAVLADGTARCWGYNHDGQLGDGTRVRSLSPVAVQGLHDAVTITTGAGQSCSVLVGGTAKCWGGNEHGQLGNGTTNGSVTPVSVSNLGDTVAVSTGLWYSCTLTVNGTEKCWGDNSLGQLGNGTTRNAPRPNIAVAGIASGAGATAIATGGYHACRVDRRRDREVLGRQR